MKQTRIPNPPASPHRKLATALACTAAAFLAPVRADITYSFDSSLNLVEPDLARKQEVRNSVTVAAAFYNQYGSFNKHWNVRYHAGIPTAEANYGGSMGFGGIRNERVVFHEAAHTFGMGTYGAYGDLIAGGTWKGRYANITLSESYGGAALNGDGHAIWPSGFNYDNEDGFLQRHWHTRIMAGMRADLGILSFTREARNEAVVVGETAEFKVESPLAGTWQWKRNNVNLVNGGDIAGANTAILRIFNAEAADAGTYTCTVTGASETLTNRPRQLWVHSTALISKYNLDGSAIDSAGSNPGNLNGGAGYIAGKSGQAVDLDGVDDYVDLPDPVGRLRELTVTSWVNWDGGGDWQRVFDFGSGVDQYLCLTPRAGGGGLRVVLKDAVNFRNQEFQVNAPVLTINQWVHLSVVVRENYMTLYVNGQVVGTTFGINSSPADFPAVNNYIGKSQFNDPYFNGRVDDFRVYGKAMNGEEVYAIWGQSANRGPVFSPTLIKLSDANGIGSYSGNLNAHATDPDGNPLTFTKLNGPAWLNVAANGTLSGVPGTADNGQNTFVVRATDPSGASSDATLMIQSFALPAAPVTSSPVAPVPDADDISSIAIGITEENTIDGTANAVSNNESTFVSETHTSKGQTFTTGANPQGYIFRSFSFQHVNWPALATGGTSYDIQPGDRWEFHIGTITGLTKTPLLKYTAAYDGAAMTGSGNSGTGRWLTFNVSAMGVQLAPSTTYYFEIAPLSGDPSFELNSNRNSSYTGGTAYRGGNAGTIGTAVNVLGGDYNFHADLKAKGVVPASTVAWWTFEDGAADAYVSYSRTAAGQYDGSIIDQSGNGNNLSVWGGSWYRFRANVPGATTPRTGAPDALSLQNANAFPGTSAIGTPLTGWSPEAWTIEATIRPDDATLATYQTIIGRDSLGSYAAEPALAAFYLSIAPNGALRVVFTDVAGNRWAVDSAPNIVQDAKWQAVAATSDGDTLSLYLKNITNGDVNYTLLGTRDISASLNPAISPGAGDGGDWDAGVFTVGRGIYNGVHGDRFAGHIDDIRFSSVALAPPEFLYTPAPPPLVGYDTWVHNYPGVGELDGFKDDPDNDGLPNGVESYFGTSPTTPGTGLTIITATSTTLTFEHPRSDHPPADVSASYRWSTDLMNWHSSGEKSGGTTVIFTPVENTLAQGTTTVTATLTGTVVRSIFVDLQVSRP